MSRPRLVLKAGITLDGRIADAFGRSQWITGPEARAAGHSLRSASDAILIGSGTLLADDPSLNTRLEGGRHARPVLLDTRLRCPAGARVLTAGLRPWIFCARDAPERSLAADVIRVPRQGGGLDIHSVLAELSERGIHRVLVEGGARVHRTLFDEDLVDELHLFIAPAVLADGPGWLAGPGFSLADAPRMVVRSVAMVGPDVQIVLCRDGVTDSVPGGTPQK
jgi:diaminohydroxyphosphoribosylaminopyrimidine deaminase/5-amino-6-(5-phosphoribosylamino)uracil reductase